VKRLRRFVRPACLRPVAGISVIAAALLAAGAASAVASDYSEGRTLCSLPTVINESSGIVASSRSDDVFFTHNDSGDKARVFAIDRSCRLLATVNISNASAVDWEDIARGPGAGGAQAIFIGDIGDNDRVRSSVTVYEITEPSVNTAKTEVTLSARATAHKLTYEDGPHDAETLLVEPKSGRIFVVTKVPDGKSGVYVAQGTVLHKVATVDFDAMASGPSLGQSPIALFGGNLATGGDVTPDGSRVVIRTYAEAFEWQTQGGDLAGAFTRTPDRVALPNEKQGEAIAYTRDGKDLVATSEGEQAPLDAVPEAPVPPPASTTTPRPKGAAGPRSFDAPAVRIVAVGGGLLVLGLVIASIRGRRRASAGREGDSR
jgi:hypothetical protein